MLVTYGWYWYSVLISCLNSILPLGLMTSAHLVNMLSYALLVYAFITLAMEYKPTNTVKFLLLSSSWLIPQLTKCATSLFAILLTGHFV